MKGGKMNSEQITLVQESFALVAPIAGVAADLFYARLFELDPKLKYLFPADLSEQKKKLMTMLQVAVASLRKPEQLIPALQNLGRRHAGYGVQNSHYETVGAALIWTLEQGLGEHFTQEVRAAWLALYGVVASTMQEAAQEAAVPV
jgi:hemoglobin-like flavoprotein